MKTSGLLFMIMSVTIILSGATSHAAPACCDPAQAQNVIKPAAPASSAGSGNIPGVAAPKSISRAKLPAPVAPQIASNLPIQSKRPAAQPPVQLSSVYGPARSPVASPGGGCCAGSNVAPVPTAARGCGAACASCLSKANVGRDLVRSSAQSSAPACCGGRGVKAAAPVQTGLSPKLYGHAEPVYAPIRQGTNSPAALTANSVSGRPKAQIFNALW